ncbi:MAG: FHA domain-containing serine/threonine-protein kinase [Pseudomonadota bacterium]
MAEKKEAAKPAIASRVLLQFSLGDPRGTDVAFIQPAQIILGRGPDCHPRLPDDETHQTASRRHCRLDIDPPDLKIQDLGSLNGTWINGRLIGRRLGDLPPDGAAPPPSPAEELHDGDRVELGDVAFVVRVTRPDRGEASDDDLDRTMMVEPRDITRAGTAYLDKTVIARSSSAPGTTCPGCGGPLLRGPDAFLCVRCQKDAQTVLQTLIHAAGTGPPELAPLRDLQVVKTLGRGTQGAVFLVRRGKDAVPLALKIMLPEMALNVLAKKMFLREIEISKHLDHPNVVRMIDAGSYKDAIFYTMEYCGGGSVDQLMARRGGKLPLREAAPIILQALEGLEFIHQVDIPAITLADGSVSSAKGLVHRDLKPANIFLARSDAGKTIAKIADVGVGKAFGTAGLSGHTRTGSVAGSPALMPRQQVINFKFVRPEVDVWAVAASFYLMLTGFFPREFPEDMDFFRVVLETQPVPIREREPSIPRELAEVIDLALRDNPTIHFQNAADLKKALKQALRKERNP